VIKSSPVWGQAATSHQYLTLKPENLTIRLCSLRFQIIVLPHIFSNTEHVRPGFRSTASSSSNVEVTFAMSTSNEVNESSYSCNCKTLYYLENAGPFYFHIPKTTRTPFAAEFGLPRNQSKLLWRTFHARSPRINPPEPRTPSKQNDLREIILLETWRGKWAYWKAKHGWELWFVRILVFFVVCLVVFAIAHIQRVPITERLRFNFLSDWVVRRDIATYEAPIKEMEASILPEDHPMSIMVREVLQRLLPSSGLEHLDWKVLVVEGPGKSFSLMKASSLA
jgi:hypothetical protein